MSTKNTSKAKAPQTEAKTAQARINRENEKKFNELALYVTELLQGFQQAGRAINRLERYHFGLIRVLLDRGHLTYDQLKEAMEELDRSEDIEVFWGVKTPEQAAADREADRQAALAQRAQEIQDAQD